MRNEGDQLRREIRAAIDGIVAGALASSVTPELVHEVLEHVGDASRADVLLPAELIQWIATRSIADISGAVRGCVDDVATWSVPPSYDDVAFPSVLLRRDLMESIKAAVVRWSIGHAVAPSEVAGISDLQRMLDAFDQTLSRVLTRSDAESLLGERAQLLGTDGWTRALREELVAGTSASNIDWRPEMVTVAPSDEVVARYISTGLMAKHVEGFARKVPDFAEELSSLIDGSIADRDQVALRARGWRKRQAQGAAANSTSYAILPRNQLAASTSETTAGSSVSVQLGHIGDHAEGRLIVTTTEVSLVVYAARGLVTNVQFAGSSATSTEMPAATEKWVVTIPRPAGPVQLRIVHADGSVFDETITLADIEP